jgi:hypothetical protein
MVFGLGGGRSSRGGTPENVVTPTSEVRRLSHQASCPAPAGRAHRAPPPAARLQVVTKAVEFWKLQYAGATEARQDSASEWAGPVGRPRRHAARLPSALAVEWPPAAAP